MVTVAGPDRDRLLDSVRAYAVERLDDGDEIRRLHAVHYGNVAGEAAPHLRGPEQVEWLQRLRAELPHFRDALRWAFTVGDHEVAGPLAASLSWFWALEGLLDEARQIAELATGMESAEPGIRSRVFSGFGLLAASFGDLARAKDSGEQGLALARSAGDPALLGDALNTLAVAQWALGELAAAAISHDEAADHYRTAGDLWGSAVVLTLRARTAFDAGEPDVAARADVALAAARRCGDRHIIGLALDQIAHIELRCGDVDSAIRRATECLALHEAINYTEGMVASLHLLGRARIARCDLQIAESLHLRALALASAISHAAGVCEALEDLAVVSVHADDPELALRLLTVADRERAARNLPRRRSDVDDIERLRASATNALATRAPDVVADASLIPLTELVKEVLAS
jgi:tetratricopeptide (TPR) repeat protein